MDEKYNAINAFILKNFNLRPSDKSDAWVEYTDGLKTLFISEECFYYYFNSSETIVPITPDIAMLVEFIRDQVLGVTAKYTIFKDWQDFVINLNADIINDKLKEIIDEKH